MKTFRLLIVSLLLATSASAQHHRGERRGGDYSPTVYLISVHEVDTIYNCGGCAAQQAAALNRMAVGNATQAYIDTHRPGFQQTEKPQFVFASKNNRFSFSIGGFVSLRAGYDFDGIVDNIDFIPAYIPGGSKIKNQFQMDASTSTIFLKLVGHTKILGDFIVYTAGNFRDGSNKGFQLRNAYESFRDVTVGYTYGGFMDLGAPPSTIDFQGPNGATFYRATQVAYTYKGLKNFRFNASVEVPSVDGTTDSGLDIAQQRMPDFTAYAQYGWNSKSH